MPGAREGIALIRDLHLPADAEYALFRGTAEQVLGLKSHRGGQS